jgi:hypothetical protein
LCASPDVGQCDDEKGAGGSDKYNVSHELMQSSKHAVLIDYAEWMFFSTRERGIANHRDVFIAK